MPFLDVLKIKKNVIFDVLICIFRAPVVTLSFVFSTLSFPRLSLMFVVLAALPFLASVLPTALAAQGATWYVFSLILLVGA